MKLSVTLGALAFATAFGTVPVCFAADALGVESVTFNAHIAPIVNQRCASCHRPGQAAPFSLLSYEDVAKRAQLIQAVTQTRYMPPWHAEPGHGSFKDERRMLDAEIELIAKWVDAGTPEGQGSPPEAPEFAAGWILGEPDLVISMEEPFTIPADGRDIYRNFAVRVPTTEDKWIRALEFRPQARTVVHHSLFKADPSGTARELDARDPEPGFRGMGGARIQGLVNLSGWAVGGNARVFPKDAPLRLPAGSDFIFQSHFHPSGKEETEISSVAFYFTDKPATRSRLGIALPPNFGTGAGINIAPGDSEFTIGESFTLPAPVELYGVTPHAHYIGKEFKSWAELPDGEEVPLIWIKDWDFAWQDMYIYEEPVVLPAGATIHARIRYDNSADNPRNPSNPPKRVFWGQGSEDEMGTISFSALAVNSDDESLIRRKLNLLRAKHLNQSRRFRQEMREIRASRER